MKVCLIGYGAIAEYHAQALSQIDGVEFRWLVGRRSEPTEEFARRWGFEQKTQQLNEALTDDAVDVVIVTSPNALHASQATAALQAGKHVLLEIPIALTIEDAERVAQLARQVDRKLMICHTMRTYPSLTHIRQLVEAGKFHMIHFAAHFFIRRRTNITWSGNPRSWTDNILWHHGAHLIDLAMWLGDCFEVERLSYHVGPDYQQQGTMDMSFSMTLASGSIATVSLSYFAPVLKWNASIIGYENTYQWNEGKLCDLDENEVVPRHSHLDLLPQDAEFVAAVRENRDPAITADKILPAMRAIAEAQKIADVEKPVARPYP